MATCMANLCHILHPRPLICTLKYSRTFQLGREKGGRVLYRHLGLIDWFDSKSLGYPHPTLICYTPSQANTETTVFSVINFTLLNIIKYLQGFGNWMEIG